MGQVPQSSLPSGPPHIDRYEIVRPLGHGELGPAWLGRYTGEHGFVERAAIQTLSAELARDERIRRGFLDGARLVARLEHENVARVLTVGEWEGAPFVAFEWVDGASLLTVCRAAESRGRMVSHGPLLRVMVDVCRGLQAIHELEGEDGKPLGLVHGDVTPSHIVVGHGYAKLIELGVAAARALVSRPRAGAGKGASLYASPEQVLGRAVDRRADVWAVGAVLYRGLTGAPPFDDDAELARFAAGPPEGVVALPAAHVPPPLADILRRTLCCDPARRFETADELRAALQDSIGESDAELDFEGALASTLWVTGAPLTGTAPASEEALPAPPEDVEPMLSKGAMLGRYVVLDPLGRGGMGIVYAAYDPSLDRRVAIKLLRRASRNSQEQERLLREGMAMGRLSHPNVVAVYDVGTFAQRHFVAMELVEGETLRAWTTTPRSWREVVTMYVQAGRGLAAAHAAGVVHRDFKPDNVLIGRDGRARVLDFGVAQSVSLPRIGEGSAAREVSGAGPGDSLSAVDARSGDAYARGAIVGTPRYMPAEQLLGEEVDERADQFAFCAALWEALYGQPPFDGRDVLDLLDAIRDGKPREATGRVVPGPVRAALLRGLAVEPASRFPSMNELLAELSRVTAPPSRRWMGIGAAVAVAVVAGTALGRSTFARQAACPTAAQEAAELAGVWDDAVVAGMRQSFAASGVPDATENAERVKRKVDEFASKWLDARGEVCRAAHEGPRQPEDVTRLRTDCLDRERSEARAITALLAHADAQVARRGLRLAYALPDVRWCADVPALRASVGLPDDPDKRRQAIAIRDQLAEVAADFAAGKAAEALDKLTPVLESARQLGHAPTTARALHWKGALLVDAKPSEGYPLLHEAVWLALGVGDRELAVESSASAAKEAAVMTRADEAHQWLRGSKLLLESMGDSATDRLREQVMYTEAFVAETVDGKPEVALGINEQLVEMYRRTLGPSPRLAQAIYNVAAAKSDLQKFAEVKPLMEEALAMYESIGGPRSRDAAVAQYGLGTCLVDLGDLEGGVRVLTTAATTFEDQSFSFWLGLTLGEVSRARLLQEQVTESIAAAERSLRAVPADPRVSPEASVVEADALDRLGRFAQALPLCEQAATLMQGAGAMDPAKTYPDDALRCEAEALLGLGRAGEALPLLERSLGLTRRQHVGDYARAELAMARVLRALRKDPARARSLAVAARDELARYPYLSAEAGRAEAFLGELGSTGE